MTSRNESSVLDSSDDLIDATPPVTPAAAMTFKALNRGGGGQSQHTTRFAAPSPLTKVDPKWSQPREKAKRHDLTSDEDSDDDDEVEQKVYTISYSILISICFRLIPCSPVKSSPKVSQNLRLRTWSGQAVEADSHRLWERSRPRPPATRRTPFPRPPG